MNDFTKEDLKFIAIALERFAIKDIELDEKIQSLINTYCEHTNVKSLTDTDWAYHCCECDRIVGYQ